MPIEGGKMQTLAYPSMMSLNTTRELTGIHVKLKTEFRMVAGEVWRRRAQI